MSDFSVRCQELLNKCGLPIYQVAQRTGLERTTLQRMVKGTRLPGQQFVEDFCNFLPINPSEREELLQLFRIEKMGKDVWLCRQEVESLLCDFQKLREQLEQTSSSRPFSVGLEEISKEGITRRLNSALDVADAIRYLIQKTCEEAEEGEEIPVYMDLFPKIEVVMQEIIREEKQGRKVSCCQFLKFHHQGGDAMHLKESVHTLRTLLSFKFAFRGNYQVFYSYWDSVESDPTQIWPHYIGASSRLILLSGEADGGILIESSELASAYAARLEKMKLENYPLFLFHGETEQMLEAYDLLVAKEQMILSFDTTPCSGEFARPVLEQTIYRENKLVQQYLRIYQKHDAETLFARNYRQIIGLQGIEAFWKNGTLPGMIGNFLPPVPEAERGEVLAQYQRVIEERGDVQIFREDIPIPEDGLNLELYQPNCVFLYTSRPGYPVECVYLEETGIFQALLDYFGSLEDEGKVCRVEESEAVYARKVSELTGNPK